MLPASGAPAGDTHPVALGVNPQVVTRKDVAVGASETVGPSAAPVIFSGCDVFQMGGGRASMHTAEMVNGARDDGTAPLLVHHSVHFALTSVARAIADLGQAIAVTVAGTLPDEARADQGATQCVKLHGCGCQDQACRQSLTQRDTMGHVDLLSQVDHAPDDASRCGAFSYSFYLLSACRDLAGRVL
jgi:hypothetical protein